MARQDGCRRLAKRAGLGLDADFGDAAFRVEIDVDRDGRAAHARDLERGALGIGQPLRVRDFRRQLQHPVVVQLPEHHR